VTACGARRWYARRKCGGMTRKVLIAVLVVAAFGCARSASTRGPAVAPTIRAEKKTVAAAPVAVAQELKLDDDKPVALHGPEKTYLEQVDNSGWSGRSPALPEAIGGGPPAEDEETNSGEEQSEQK
jgi:hypothetical protein